MAVGGIDWLSSDGWACERMMLVSTLPTFPASLSFLSPPCGFRLLEDAHYAACMERVKHNARGEKHFLLRPPNGHTTSMVLEKHPSRASMVQAFFKSRTTSSQSGFGARCGLILVLRLLLSALRLAAQVYVELVLDGEPARGFPIQAVFASCIWAFWLAFIASTLGHAPKKVWAHGCRWYSVGVVTHHRRGFTLPAAEWGVPMLD